MKSILKKLLFLTTLILTGLFYTPLQAQVDDQGVTSSGKEVDCSTIDPNDAVVNEKGQIVTSPRLTRNGKLITTECGFVVTVTGDNSAAFCDGNSKSVTYTATVPAEIAGVDVVYKWYVDDVQQASTTNTMTVSYSTAGEYAIRCEVSKGVQSGIGAATTTVTVYPLPTVIISGDFVVCRTTPEALTATSGYSTYVWSSNVSSSTGNTAQVVNAGTYTVTVTDANGCTNSTSQDVTVSNPQVTGVVSISGTTSICYNAGTTLTASATASTGATLYYQWYKDGSIITGATSNELSTGDLLADATYKCVVYAQQGDCKSDTKEASASVTVNHPVAGTETLTADNAIVCAGGNTTLRVSVSGNTGTLTYKWYKDGNAVSGSSNTLNTGALNATSTFKCVVTATLNGCTASTEKEVTVTVPNPTPGTISITTEPIIICHNSSAVITATATGSVGTLSYQWYKNNTIIPGATSASYTTGNLTETATYKCVVTATKDGCTSSSTTASKEVVVNNPQVTSNVTISGTTSICAGTTTTLTANATASTGATLTYQWYKGSTAISGATSKNYTTEELSAATTYKCVVTAQIGDCVSASKEASTTVGILPAFTGTYDVTSNANVLCAGTNSVTLTATASPMPAGATATYQWYKGTTAISGATSSTYTVTDLSSTTTFKCQSTITVDGCPKDVEDDVTVAVLSPKVNNLTVTGNAYVCSPDNVTLVASANNSIGTLTYQWASQDGDIAGATNASYTIAHLPHDTMNYTVKVKATLEDGISCEATATKDFRVIYSHPHTYDTLLICECLFNETGNRHTIKFPGGNPSQYAFQNGESKNIVYRSSHNCDSVVTYTAKGWDIVDEKPTSCTGVYFANAGGIAGDGETIVNGELKSVTFDGYEYKVVQIGNQCWLKENVRAMHFADGTPLYPISDYASTQHLADRYYWVSTASIPSKGPCDGNLTMGQHRDKYGLMYNWYTACRNENPPFDAHNVQGICPNGWHLPDTAEFHTFEHQMGIGVNEYHSQTTDQFLGTTAVEMVTGCEWRKHTDGAGTVGDYTAANRNKTGFSARPGGCFLDTDQGGYFHNTFGYVGEWNFFWTCTRFRRSDVSTGNAAYNYDLHYDRAGISRDVNGNDHWIGRSVRCIRNAENVIGITSTTPGDGQATCSYQVAIDGQSGVCWSTSQNPTVADSHTDVASVAGAYTSTLSPLVENTLYYARAYVMVDGNPVYSNQVTVTALSKPVVVTMPAVAYTTSATLKGNVTNDGGYANTVRGICWSTSENPTLDDNVLIDVNQGAGEYSVEATSLSTGVTYHCRAYATNAKGTVYGTDVAFTVNPCTGTVADIEHSGSDTYHVYPIGQRGSYCWMLRSVRSAKLSDGTAISKVLNPKTTGYTPEAHANTTTLYKPITVWDANNQVVEFNENHWTAYGYFYNYAAAKQVCPSGWHLPTWTEWNDLENWAIQNYGCDGGAAKALAEPDATWKTSAGNCHPGYNPSVTNNATGFMAFPCGYVGNGAHTKFNETVNFWIDNGDHGNWVYLFYNNSAVQKDKNGNGDQHGFSVRCVRDH